MRQLKLDFLDVDYLFLSPQSLLFCLYHPSKWLYYKTLEWEKEREREILDFYIIFARFVRYYVYPLHIEATMISVSLNFKLKFKIFS